MKDRQVWEGNEFGEFSVKNAYARLTNHGIGLHQNVFRHFWMVKDFPNVLTTTWRAIVDRIPTRDNLSKRGVDMCAHECVMCLAVNESSQHIFQQCKVAQGV